MTSNPVQRLFDWKIRGVRWIEVIGLVCVGAMVFSVYVAKAAAARESVAIGQLEREIAENRQRVRLLRAEAARLEQPGRLEDLSRAAGLGPVGMNRQADESALAGLKPVSVPVKPPAAPAAPVGDVVPPLVPAVAASAEVPR
jgi:hypothetical protein